MKRLFLILMMIAIASFAFAEITVGADANIDPTGETIVYDVDPSIAWTQPLGKLFSVNAGLTFSAPDIVLGWSAGAGFDNSIFASTLALSGDTLIPMGSVTLTAALTPVKGLTISTGASIAPMADTIFTGIDGAVLASFGPFNGSIGYQHGTYALNSPYSKEGLYMTAYFHFLK